MSDESKEFSTKLKTLLNNHDNCLTIENANSLFDVILEYKHLLTFEKYTGFVKTLFNKMKEFESKADEDLLIKMNMVKEYIK